jgi:hypothetical protein
MTTGQRPIINDSVELRFGSSTSKPAISHEVPKIAARSNSKIAGSL